MGEYAGDVGEYAGDVGEYAGDVGEYAGDVGEYVRDLSRECEREAMPPTSLLRFGGSTALHETGIFSLLALLLLSLLALPLSWP